MRTLAALALIGFTLPALCRRDAREPRMFALAIAFAAAITSVAAYIRARQAQRTAKDAADTAVAALDAAHSLAALLAQRRSDDARCSAISSAMSENECANRDTHPMRPRRDPVTVGAIIRSRG
jgi:hypothetical protein